MKGIKSLFGGGSSKSEAPKPPKEVQTFGKSANNDFMRLLFSRGMGTTILTSEGGLPNLGTTKKPEIGGK